MERAMPRSIWKGAISFGLVQIPVGLFSAEEGDELHFNMLDGRNMAPVKYKRVNAKNGHEVPWNEIVKGYEYEEGQYVIVTDADFKAANPKATQTVDIVEFVDADEISPLYFERPYYLAPVKKGEKPYALLRETMKRSGKIGIANVVIRTRQHVAALMVVGDCLVLNLLRYAYELRDPNDLELPGDNLEKLGVTKKEIEMAERLVEGMVDKWDPSKFEDTYRRDLLAFIERKAKEGDVEEIAEPEAEGAPARGGKVVDIMSLLKKSLEEKPAAKSHSGVKGGPKKAVPRGAHGHAKSHGHAASKGTKKAEPKKRARGGRKAA
jgi:DNA end-binding protein Ku